MKRKTFVVLVCLMLVVMTLFTACSPATPSSVVKKYMDSTKNRDINGMISCFDPDTAEMVKGMLQLVGEDALLDSMGEMSGFTYSITNEEIDGDTATVTVSVTMDGDTEEQEIPCTKINGKWYLDASGAF